MSQAKKKNKQVRIAGIKIGGNEPIVLIAGPCVIENEAITLRIASALREISQSLKIPLIFKASYDKANRTSINSFRGPGIKEGLRILSKVKEKFDIPVTSDVHCKEEVKEAKSVLDLIQIPAFLSRQTDLLIEAGRTGKPLNIKKGQFLAPWDIKKALEKLESIGNTNILLTERGYSFGYNNLIADMRSLVLLRDTGYPVVFDASHSVQIPGGKVDSSGGERRFIPFLSRAASAVGIDGLFLEVHPRPEKALSDGPNSVRLKDLQQILEKVMEIDELIKGFS